MNTFFLKIISSDKVFYEGKCQNLILPMEDGQFSILAHHENMVVAVANGELHLKTPEGEWITAEWKSAWRRKQNISLVAPGKVRYN